MKESKSTGTPRFCISFFPPFSLLFQCTSTPTVTCLMAISAVVSVLFFEEKLLGNKVSSECDSRDAETGKGTLKTVPPREGTRVSPLFAVNS